MPMIKEHPTNTFSWRFILLHYAIGYVLAVVASVLLSIITTILGFPLGGVAYVVIVLYGAGAYLAYRYIKTYDAYPSKRLGWKISAATSPVTIIFSVIFFLLGKEAAPQLPQSPEQTYQNAGWSNWGTWLGAGRISTKSRKFREFEEAREFVRGLKLRSKREFDDWSKSENRPSDIPSTPHKTYESKGWISYTDWLGKSSSPSS